MATVTALHVKSEICSPIPTLSGEPLEYLKCATATGVESTAAAAAAAAITGCWVRRGRAWVAGRAAATRGATSGACGGKRGVVRDGGCREEEGARVWAEDAVRVEELRIEGDSQASWSTHPPNYTDAAQFAGAKHRPRLHMSGEH
jgi:hypothetical protein